jgi:hypothetical protein
MSFTEGSDVTFTQKGSPQIRAVYGLLFSYHIKPQWSIEAAVASLPTNINYTMYHPQTAADIGWLNITTRYWQYQFGTTLNIAQLNSYNQLKAIAGLTVLNTNSVQSNALNNQSIDTNFVKYSSRVSGLELNNFNQYAWGMMFGLGNEIIIKQKAVAEIRLCARYHINPIAGAYSLFSNNGVLYKNEYIANKLSFDASVLINLSALLGAKSE